MMFRPLPAPLSLPLPDGSRMLCRVRLSERARTIRLRVLPHEGEVELVLPRHTDPETAEKFALSKLDWIIRSRQTVLQQYAAKKNDRKNDLFPKKTVSPVSGRRLHRGIRVPSLLLDCGKV